MTNTLIQETAIDVNVVMQQSQHAFDSYKKISAADRAAFLEKIAEEIEAKRAVLVSTANAETNLPEARLNGEISRTTNQLKLFASLIKEGSWVEAAIDTADATRTPARPDIRKVFVPLGPVVVFGASNFPFAFSTAGGDTASALAAGCSVVIKAHNAHVKTSELVFEAMQIAIEACKMPQHLIQHATGKGNVVGKALVQHPNTTAVSFTGSFSGGRALCDYSNERQAPIPVFAEMSSINPVVFFPDTLQKNAAALAQTYAGSITVGMGQFCTNPGLLLAVKSEALDNFLQILGEEITKVAPQKMLHSGIYHSYNSGLDEMLLQKGIQVVARVEKEVQDIEAQPTVAKVSGQTFLANPHFKEEVFGPFSLAIVCEDAKELKAVLSSLKGQLTTTMMATEEDLTQHQDIFELQQTLAGRIILNNVPTGVEVCAAMVHGGPFPATTDARFTSVGTSSIKRWVRPLCFQNFPDSMLPEALKNDNPLNILRIVNNEWTREKISKK
ncbi:aldehyde dehydrogenase (NADP(+)) [Danxiaibacter flavus]|uniref:Aldehyde dehydrogenase (NADP(+)) n=1 Tax=Danxiaibacter flavus TaxID=3049108 RepID=A0ABV3ZKR6_9BACT|nr:aldehyde dehydrogenase (NADP(+)) [Chitinophagaceae bacterium DXS]